jgi:hypothetical protein
MSKRGGVPLRGRGGRYNIVATMTPEGVGRSRAGRGVMNTLGRCAGRHKIKTLRQRMRKCAKEFFMKKYFFIVMMLYAAFNAFAQEVTISPKGYGVEMSGGIPSGEENFFHSYSASFQSMMPGKGWSLDGMSWSLDYIANFKDDTNDYIANFKDDTNGYAGLLGSLFFGFPIGTVFELYGGGGLGVKFLPYGGYETIEFAWKVDGGVLVWVSDIGYVKAGVMYDSVRENTNISVGLGVRLFKYITDTYYNDDGTTFPHTITKLRWLDDNSTYNAIYSDKFERSEVVRRYRKTTNSSIYTPSFSRVRTSGGEVLTTEIKDTRGNTIATATTRTPRKAEVVKSGEAKVTTTYYVYDVTVTRNWYTRTWYYKDDRGTVTQKVYQDTESAVLVDEYSETEKR